MPSSFYHFGPDIPHAAPHLSPPLSFPGSVFVSLRLNFAHLLSALMEGGVWRAPLRSCIRSESGGGTPGRRRNAILRNICQARRLDEGCSSKAQQEAFVEKGKITPLRPETANWHLCRKVSRLCYANVRALNLVGNMDFVFQLFRPKMILENTNRMTKQRHIRDASNCVILTSAVTWFDCETPQ